MLDDDSDGEKVCANIRNYRRAQDCQQRRHYNEGNWYTEETLMRKRRAIGARQGLLSYEDAEEVRDKWYTPYGKGLDG